MQINLSDHFNYSRLLRFTLPSIAMVVFSSIYGVVDGLFVANYAGKQAFCRSEFVVPSDYDSRFLGYDVWFWR